MAYNNNPKLVENIIDNILNKEDYLDNVREEKRNLLSKKKFFYFIF